MKKINFCKYIILSLLIFSLLTSIDLEDANANEKTIKENTLSKKVEVKDSIGNAQPESKAIIKDSLLISDSLQVDIETTKDTVLTDSTIINPDTIMVEVDSTHFRHVPYLFNKNLSFPLLSTRDSSKVHSYITEKAYPPQTLKIEFLENTLYKYNDSLDLKNKTAVVSGKIANADYVVPYLIPLDRYLELRAKREFDQLLVKKLKEYTKEQEKEGESGGIIPDIQFPDVKLPKSMRRILGDNLGSLRVNGSQKITFSGQTIVEDPPPVSEGYEKSLFPDLQMKQELNLSIHGTIGEKIKVDVTQQSNESVFKKNKLNVKYEGDEDDPIRLIEGGDTRLSLSQGSSLVSYSASSEDLFGIKGEFQFGDLNIKTILSQQEGEQASAQTKGSSLENVAYYKDMDFSHRYFFLVHPDTLYSEAIDSTIIDWANDTTYNDNLLPQEGTLQVFMDDRREDITDIEGYDNEGNEYAFKQLVQGEDFFINYNYPYLVEISSVYDNYAIGIVYTAKNGQQIGAIPGDGQPITVKMIKKDYTSMNLKDALWDYLAKNIYFLGAKEMDPDGFGIKLTKEKSTGERVEGVTDLSDSTFIKFIEMLDLDSNGNGKLDNGDVAVDLDEGTLRFPMMEPFRDYWFRNYDSLWTTGELGNDIIYEELNPDETEFNPFFLEVKSKTGTSVIDLGHINIIKGSERVTVDGKVMTKGVDYNIDYFSGTVTLKGDASSDPNANVEIDYEYRPLMSLDKKTMMGFQANYNFNDDSRLGATMMYQIGSSSDKHPKIGAEPKHNLVGALDGSIKTEAQFLTDLVNKIPLIKTNESSNISLSGEIGMNLPNPNTTDSRQAYIDDMEGVVEEFSLGINRPEWNFASYPVNILDESNIVDTLNKTNRADFWWYNPPDKYDMEDLYDPDDLSDEEKRESVPVLECKLKPIHEEPTWSGIMKSTGAIDLSRKKYINIVVRSNAIEGDTLYLNLGYINEDSYPIFHPNGRLDKEDGIVFEDGELDVGEDIGFDHVEGEDPDPPLSHDTDGDIGENDDGNDDYWYDSNNEDDFEGLNGTEGNGKLDTEDLNRDKNFSTVDGYFEYAIDLSNLDIEDDIVTNVYNDWKFLKIPVQDSSYYKTQGSTEVDFKIIKYARVWFKRTNVESPSFYDSLIVDLQSIGIVGNKWIASPVLDSTLHTPYDISANEKFEVTAINNRENLNYEPAPGSVIKNDATTGTDILIEQSIALQCENLPGDRYVYARQNFLDANKLLKYKKIKVWVYGQKYKDSDTPDEEIFVFRLGTDTLNYYEYRDTIEVYSDLGEKMQKDRWQEVSINFNQFSELKKTNIPDTTSHFRIVGEPNLNNTKQVAVGLYRPQDAPGIFTGRINVDDIRVADPYDDMGMATKLSFNTNIADFAQITANLSGETPNFYSIGETSGSGKRRIQYNINNTVNIDKIFPDRWNIKIPVTYNYSRSEETPRYAPNSDIQLTTKAEKDSAKIFNNSNLFKFSFNKNSKSDNFLVHYLIDNLSFNGRIKKQVSTSPTRRDTSQLYAGNARYNLKLPELGFKLFSDRLKLNIIPDKINLNVNYNHRIDRVWTNASNDGINEFIKEQSDPTRRIKPTVDINYELISDLTTNYSLETTRNLEKRNVVSNVNIGVEENRSQQVNLNYNPFFLKFINFSSDYTVKYQQDRQEVVESDSVTNSYYNVNNNRNSSVNVTLDFDKWGSGLVEKIEGMYDSETKNVKENTTKNIQKQNINKNQKQQQISPQKQIMGEQIGEEQQSRREEEIQEIQPENEKENIKESGEEVTQKTDETDDEKVKEEKEGPPVFKRAIGFSGKMLGNFLKILGSTALKYNNSIQSKYETSIDSIPSIEYQIGWLDETSGKFKSNSSSNEFIVNQTKNFQLDGLISGLSTSLKTSYKQKYSQNSGSKSKSINFTLPNISFTYSGLDDIIKSNLFQRTSLQTQFSREIAKSGEGFWETPLTESENFKFYPILSLNTKFYGKFPLSLSCNYSYKLEENRSINNIKSRTNDLSFRTKIQYSFKSPQGIKILFFKRLKMRNELTTSLDISYNISRQESKRTNEDWGYQMNDTTLKIEPRIQYDFSRDIDGGLNVSYKIADDKKKNKKTTTTNVSLWINFRF